MIEYAFAVQLFYFDAFLHALRCLYTLSIRKEEDTSRMPIAMLPAIAAVSTPFWENVAMSLLAIALMV